MNKPTIGILGCGWLGLPLAESLHKEGFTVKGTTTSAEKISDLEKKGITPFLISLSENKVNGNISEFLKDLSILVINIPPKLRGENKENYVSKMQHLNSALENSAIEKIIFASSTAVYGNIDGEVTEETVPEPNTESGIQLIASENVFKDNNKLQTTVIRFGGLIDAKRHPITMLVKRKELFNGDSPVNLIHLNDCISIVKGIIKNNWWNTTINAVYPDHPQKKEYYSEIALKKNLPLPNYIGNDKNLNKKVVISSVLNAKQFVFSTPLNKDV